MWTDMEDFGDFYDGSQMAGGGGAGDMLSMAGTGAAAGGPWGAAIGAGVGLIKHVQDKRDHQRMLQDRATQIRLAPFTGSNIQQLANTGRKPSPWDNALAFGSAGAGLGQSFDKAAGDAALRQAQIGVLDRAGGAPAMNYGTVAEPAPGYRASPESYPVDFYEGMGLDRYGARV